MLCFSEALSDQPVVDTATATEQAKMLIKSGAISAIKSENKNSGFKRSRTLEGKLKVRNHHDAEVVSFLFLSRQHIQFHLAACLAAFTSCISTPSIIIIFF